MGKKTNQLKNAFITGVGYTGGYMAVRIAMALFTLIIGGFGLYLFTNFNKENTELQEQLTALQIVGIILMVLSIFPWMGTIVNAMIYTIVNNILSK